MDQNREKVMEYGKRGTPLPFTDLTAKNVHNPFLASTGLVYTVHWQKIGLVSPKYSTDSVCASARFSNNGLV